MSYERKSVWIVEQYLKDESEAISAWTTQALAVQAAESCFVGDSNVEKQVDVPEELYSWRSDQRQIFVRKLLILDTWGYEPAPKKKAQTASIR